MVLTALAFGMVSYLVFFLAWTARLKDDWLLFPLVAFCLVLLIKLLQGSEKMVQQLRNVNRKDKRIIRILTFLLIAMVFINFLGLLVPEISFDALWYHLTLPKLYLQEGRIKFFKGGLLYYSAMPQAMEMIYLLGLKYGGQILARSFHFVFGLLSLIAVFHLARKFLSPYWSLLASLLFYSQLVVAWLSSAAYVDLTRTFLEIVGLILILQWLDQKKKVQLVLAGTMMGLAMAVKLLSLASVISLMILIYWFSAKKLKDLVFFAASVVTTLTPWLVYGLVQTKSGLYPFLTDWFWETQTIGRGPVSWFLSRTAWSFIQSIIKTAFTQGDILTPVFLIGLPILIFKLKVFKERKSLFLSVYLVLNLFFWFLTPLNYNRFLLPYTPCLIILLLLVLNQYSRLVKKIFICLSILIASLHLGIRFLVVWENLTPFFQGQTREEFLQERFRGKKDVFWDNSGFLRANLGQDEKVLIVGSHNLFYLPVAFDHYSWIEGGVEYKYLVVQGSQVPPEFKALPLVSTDKEMNIYVYQFNQKTGN